MAVPHIYLPYSSRELEQCIAHSGLVSVTCILSFRTSLHLAGRKVQLQVLKLLQQSSYQVSAIHSCCCCCFCFGQDFALLLVDIALVL